MTDLLPDEGTWGPKWDGASTFFWRMLKSVEFALTGINEWVDALWRISDGDINKWIGALIVFRVLSSEIINYIPQSDKSLELQKLNNRKRLAESGKNVEKNGKRLEYKRGVSLWNARAN